MTVCWDLIGCCVTKYPIVILCHYVHCCLLQSVHCLSISHTVSSVGCVTMSTAVFYSLSTVCQYLTLYSLLVVSLCPLLSSTVCPLSVSTSHCTVCWLCHYVHCCLVQSVHCLSVSHTVPSVGCVIISTAVFYSLSTVCQYLTLYSLLVVSLCPLLSSTFCPLSVSTSHCTICWLCHYVHWCLLQSVHCLSVSNSVPSVGCVTMPTAVFYILSTVCQYLTLYRLLVVSLCPLLSSTVCPLSVSI